MALAGSRAGPVSLSGLGAVCHRRANESEGEDVEPLGLHDHSPFSPRGGEGNTVRTRTRQVRWSGSTPVTGAVSPAHAMTICLARESLGRFGKSLLFSGRHSCFLKRGRAGDGPRSGETEGRVERLRQVWDQGLLKWHRLCLSLGRDDCGLVLSENTVAFAISLEDGSTRKSDTSGIIINHTIQGRRA